MQISVVRTLAVQLVAIALYSGLLYAPLAAQSPVWTQVFTTGPGPRHSHAMAYDSQRGRTVLFAGWNGSSCPSSTWKWDGNVWMQVASTGPSARDLSAMAYDSQRSRTVLFGGWANPPLSDTWEFSTGASFTNYGAGCPGSLFTVSPCAELNPGGGTLTGTTAPLEFGILAGTGPIDIQSFDVFTQSTGGTQTIPAHIYPFSVTTPFASTTMTVGPTPGFYTATFPVPVAVAGPYLIAIDVSSQTVVVPSLTAGSLGTVYSRTPPSGSWAYSATVNRPAFQLACVQGTVYHVPALGNVGTPALGTTYDVTLSNALPSTGALSLTGLSDSIFQGLTLPYHLPNAPGCDVLASPDATRFVFTSPTGTATHSITVPSSTSYIGIELFHQWAVLDAVNPLGIIVSDAGKA